MTASVIKEREGGGVEVETALSDRFKTLQALLTPCFNVIVYLLFI